MRSCCDWPLVERVFSATWDRCGGAHKGMDAREPPRVSPTPARVAHSSLSTGSRSWTLRALSGLPRVNGSDPTRSPRQTSRSWNIYGRPLRRYAFLPAKKVRDLEGRMTGAAAATRVAASPPPSRLVGTVEGSLRSSPSCRAVRGRRPGE